MTNTTKQSQKLCEQCGSKNIKARRMTYPIQIGKKQLTIGRVSVKECVDCHAIKPTIAGEEKIARGTLTFMSLLERHGVSCV